MPTPVLGDFGQATTRPTLPCGTPGYLSPEQLDPERYGAFGTPSDLYALGVTLYDLCLGLESPPWETGADPGDLVLPPWLRGLSIQSFLEQCLAVDPRDRIAMTASQDEEFQGLEYMSIFRHLRETMSKTITIRPEIWFNLETAPSAAESESESEDEMQATDMDDEAEEEDKDAEMSEFEEVEMEDEDDFDMADEDSSDDSDFVDDEEGESEY